MTPKRRVDNLALFGGERLFSEPRHVNKPNSPPRELFDRYLDTAWSAAWFSNDGPLLRRFEARLCEQFDVRHCIVTCNATAALDIVLQALRLPPGGEVILPSYTFVSTANLLRLAGLKPVFCDIAADSMNADPEQCARLISSDTVAIIPTHVWGVPCDIDALEALSDQSGVPLLFDAAHAYGAVHGTRRIGGFGLAEIFSLHATKALHAFEGGIIATDDDALADDLRLRRNFGFSGNDQVDLPGVNAKMSEAHAAMGLANLDVFARTIAASRLCHETYEQGLRGIPGLVLRMPDPASQPNYHYVVAELDAQQFGMDRDTLTRLLFAENIWARRYFYPGVHRMTPHLPLAPQAPVSLPQTERACNRVLVLPAGAAIDLDDVRAICTLLRFISENAAVIAGRS
ncbi:DegT/DnrJ/EryC1/StrS family aminotransferase [Ruegeria aquimaris]|uniref:Aminotransferase class I/II-fold pyridoxal phosphate-dependent enzyme n=1 Tax=Ruegeria aquimaris TaxID=2984333 RepID=A0ABT3AR78_9RHOB|nr:DegT/DnrJ/EryC1/StrS family aminotransferase [Ruegeria sp. XHP0148]MCV2891185.1 aminotransferase class I/II-fold pyridoxal phosphate-dependent enzyme [Ruegeria sp. XHP0148]